MKTRPVIFRSASNEVEVGWTPRVVGTLSTLSPKCDLAGDIIEVRLDKLEYPADWVKRCVSLQVSGKPVLLTIRHRAEGGDWAGDDSVRLELYREGLRELAAVDVELSGAISVEVGREAVRLGKASVISFHDFEKTPPLDDLCAFIEKAHAIGSIAKVSTMIQKESDVNVLRALLSREWRKPVCVIGMGQAWSSTRIEFAKLGSCLTYGYIDKPTAQGQISAAELVRRVRLTS